MRSTHHEDMQDHEDALGMPRHPTFRTMTRWGDFLISEKQSIALYEGKLDFFNKSILRTLSGGSYAFSASRVSFFFL